MQYLNVCFKCTWNDAGFRGVCSNEAYNYNVSHKRVWCSKAKCRGYEGVPSRGNEPCYESIIFSEWMYGAGWDHKNIEKPRNINGTGEGKLVFLTTVEPDMEEGERKFIGFFKISKITGGEKQETILMGDPAEGFEVPSNINLKFWDFYKNPNAPDKKHWGTGLFRYIDDQPASKILGELKSRCQSLRMSETEILKIDKALSTLSGTNAKIKPPALSKKMFICPACKKRTREGATYCTQCGAKLMRCRGCENLNLSEDKFCSSCGSPLKPEDPPPKHTLGSAEEIKKKLLEFGQENKKSLDQLPFTGVAESDKFVRNNPLAFLFGVIFDQDIQAERAWSNPYELSKRLGHFDINRIAGLKDEEIETHFSNPTKLHRYWKTTGERIVNAAKKVIQEYGGEASNIWNDNPKAKELEKRFLDFDGIGQKKASMAVNILGRDLGIPVREWSGIDVSNDVMVRRLFLRTGLVERDTQKAIIETARKLHPEYPGELDLPAWMIGRDYCLKSNPLCGDCPLNPVCPKLIR